MKEFLLLVKGEDHNEYSMEETKTRLEKYRLWMEEMISKGNYMGGEPLKKGGKHLIDANTIISDGPFLETKEIIGGYILIKAEDLDDAVEITKTCPLLGEFEIIIRPIYHNLADES